MGVIVDQSGRSFQDSAYEGASWYSRDLANWLPVPTSADADMLYEMDTLTGRHRDLERNNGIAANAPSVFVDHVIGPKLKLSATPDWRALGQSKEWAKEWSMTTENLWKPYAASLWFDSQEQINFTGQAEQVLRGRFGSGGHVVVPMWLPDRPGARWSTAFQSVEIDRLCNPNNAPDTDRMRGGIEFNDRGAPAKYWIRNTHPGDFYGTIPASAGYDWEPIPARTPWGRQQVLHCFHKKRSGQSRGVPATSSVLREFKALARYRGAELNAAVSNAMVTYFLETQMQSQDIADLLGAGTDFISQRRDFNKEHVGGRLRGATMDENTVVPIFPGDKVHQGNQGRPNQEFSNFCTGVLRYIAAGFGISYETLLRDFSKTNYSSARAAMLLDWKTFIGWREWMIVYFCRPAYALWLEEAVNVGAVEALNFYDNIDAYTSCNFVGAGRGMVDPTKETRASMDKLHNGISTLEDEAAEQGKDYQDVQQQRAREIREAFDIAREMNLPEHAAYVLAGLPMPSSDLLTTPAGPNSGLFDDPDRNDRESMIA